MLGPNDVSVLFPFSSPRGAPSQGFERLVALDRYLSEAVFAQVRAAGEPQFDWHAPPTRIPSDLSSPRLCDRAFDLLDHLNNRGLRKRLLGEVDVFQFDHTPGLVERMGLSHPTSAQR